ncbi:phenoloxidase-activating factor 2-like [Drosophila elegans]|uniref:phenoloxidase-activating factor 2-like n=1 Tax=Drosophila elegans TaxID=30023 RepID=UPI0007E60D3B|nr:phenoloxidase-activating factor 2-like [Drosophila elegans]
MRRLHEILSILCLLLATYQVLGKNCHYSRAHSCVPRHQCHFYTGFTTLLEGNYGCPSTNICCRNQDINPYNSAVVTNAAVSPDCGWTNSRGVTFAMDDLEGLAQEAEFPWMVALLELNRKYVAGGALISSDVVITASDVSHNYNANQLIVRAGEWDFRTKTEQLSHVDAGIRLIVRHPEYNRQTGANNVALLFLKTPLRITRHINPICLPTEDWHFDNFDNCIFSGWGYQSFNEYTNMNILKKLEFQVIPGDMCQDRIWQDYASRFQLDNSLMCAVGRHTIGDGMVGSPLACRLRNDPQRYELAGIFDFSLNSGTLGVYTNVAKLRSWILLEALQATPYSE